MNEKVRLYWLDWMKTIGMFFIVWGHIFPEHFTDFVYAFNVPLFYAPSCHKLILHHQSIQSL